MVEVSPIELDGRGDETLPYWDFSERHGGFFRIGLITRIEVNF